MENEGQRFLLSQDLAWSILLLDVSGEQHAPVGCQDAEQYSDFCLFCSTLDWRATLAGRNLIQEGQIFDLFGVE